MRRLEWEKVKISEEPFEAAGVGDINQDGVLDIVSGGYWYEGPKWAKHRVAEVPAHGEYHDDFATAVVDVNGDGYPDVVSCAWFRKSIFWYENPKGDPTREWPLHMIDSCGNAETLQVWDVDGDGDPEFVPNTPGDPIVVYKLVRDEKGRGTGSFKKFTISDRPTGHGLGFGDVNGDGRGDFIVKNGWWEAPKRPLAEPWIFHPEFEFGSASIPMIVADFNGDGRAEIIVGSAHNYGIGYYQQSPGDRGARTWQRRPIDPYFSQYHTMLWVDIDRDGQQELITGNRYRAHCGNDHGETDVAGLYSFKWNGEFFTKQVIDHGRVPHASGTGLFMTAVDIDGNGWLDIVAPGKDGLYLFKNLGPEHSGK
jgi:hypothetical protein